MIVGIDTASNRWHAVDEAGRVAYCSELKNKAWTADDPRDTGDLRRRELLDVFGSFVRTLVAIHGAEDLVFICEEPIAGKNGKTTRLLGLAGGALWAVVRIYAPEARWIWVDIAQWKSNIVGNGNADKDQIREFVLATYDVDQAEYDEQLDLYDAHCIMEMGKIWIATGRPQTQKEKADEKRAAKAAAKATEQDT